MKRKTAFVLTYACVALLGGLGLTILLFAEKAPRASEKENRMLAGFPTLSWATLRDGSFMTGLESYLSDAFFNRDGVVDATSRLSALFSLDTSETSLEAEVEAFAEEDAEEDAEAIAEGNATSRAETASVTAESAGAEDSAALSAADSQGERTAEDAGDASQGKTAAASDADTFSDTGEEASSDAEEELGADAYALEEEEDYNPYDTTVDAEGWRKGSFWRVRADGTAKKVYNFPIENLKNAAEVLNAYRAILPEDGKVYFAQIPFRETGLSLTTEEFIAWGCDVEELIDAHTDENVVPVSAPDALEEHLLAGEYLYFNTDHHWTPRAASYLAQAFLRAQGAASYAYDDYRYTVLHGFYGSRATTAAARAKMTADDLEILNPSLPTESYLIDANGRETESVYMVKRSSYLSYLGGTLGPWRHFVTGAHTGRSCIVIGDSYSNCFIPYLMPYYDDVYSADFRKDYFNASLAGCTLTEFVQAHGIDDIYFIPSTASSINSGYMLNHLWKYL